ncbi:hypothetical protein AB0M43_30390 [Longispora sp. NPDC051575]|uniref:hypothetical protein n=1 Tax=Longispora sp. NPDC051575 TaxID=3154943 RepID=UPI00343CBB0A
MVITVGPTTAVAPIPPAPVEQPPVAVPVPEPKKVDRVKPPVKPVPTPVAEVPAGPKVPEGLVPIQSPPPGRPLRPDPLGPGSLSPIGVGPLAEGLLGGLGLEGLVPPGSSLCPERIRRSGTVAVRVLPPVTRGADAPALRRTEAVTYRRAVSPEAHTVVSYRFHYWAR